MADSRHRVHDYSERPCPACGKVFRPSKNQAQAIGTGRQKTIYCSGACFREATKSKRVKEPKPVKPPMYSRDPIKCPMCGVMFTPDREQSRALATGRQKTCYCSTTCYRKHIPIKRSGENNPHYKGGVSSSHGYVIVREKWRSPKQPYVGEHLLVMEKIIGRRLLPNEVVHHENGDKTDNRPENLRLMTQREHMSLHATKMHAERRAKKNEYVPSSAAV